MGSCPPVAGPGHRHEALFHAGPEELLAGIVPFVRDGLAAGDPVIALVTETTAALLRDALGGDADRVVFSSIEQVGNPARIIPTLRDLIQAHGEQADCIRIIGQPVRPELGPATLAECHRHEGLLNVAFDDSPALWVVCPYDSSALADEVLSEAERTHPFVRDGARAADSASYAGDHVFTAPLEGALPRPARPFSALAFDIDALSEVRAIVAHHARLAGMSDERREDLVLAVSEIATNSVVHGGGAGVLRVWHEAGALVCETRDRGSISDPLAGRIAPEPGQLHGRGLWLANQMCDLVQIRSSPAGGSVRVHMRV